MSGCLVDKIYKKAGPLGVGFLYCMVKVGFLLNQQALCIIVIQANSLSAAKLPCQYPFGKSILQLLLDKAFQRSGTKGRIKTCFCQMIHQRHPQS